MQFKVPQFLEIEDKIFGPFTFREFAYMAGGAGLCFVFYKLFGLFWGAIPILAMAVFSLTLTFYRPNGKPFVYMVESFLRYTTQNKLYIWKRQKNTKKGLYQTGIEEKNELINETGVRLNRSKLRDLAWSLDVLDSNKQKENNL